jgi:hypothetical protein
MRTTPMRMIHPLAALLAAPLAVGSAQQPIEVHRAATPTVSVRIGGDVSSVRVIGWDRDSVAITGSVGAGSRFDGGPNVTSGPASGLKYFVDTPDGASIAANRLEIRVPARARVWVKAGSAEVEASGVTGGLDLNIVGGSVRVRGAPRELLVESMDGNVTVEGTPAYARLKTATGDVELRGGAEDVVIATVSGAVRLSGGAVQRGRFETVTGSVTYAAEDLIFVSTRTAALWSCGCFAGRAWSWKQRRLQARSRTGGTAGGRFAGARGAGWSWALQTAARRRASQSGASTAG